MNPIDYRVYIGNVDKVYPIKEVIESNVDPKDKNTGRKILYTDIVPTGIRDSTT